MLDPIRNILNNENSVLGWIQISLMTVDQLIGIIDFSMNLNLAQSKIAFLIYQLIIFLENPLVL